jgi:L-cysteine desulfidase
MDKNNWADSHYLNLLKKELVKAMGCTEPVATVLIAATVREAFGQSPSKVVIRASRETIKNAMHASIPNTTLKGMEAAVALGLVSGDVTSGLNILSTLEVNAQEKAEALLGKGIIELTLVEGVPPLFIEVRLVASDKVLGARVINNHSKVEVLEGEELDRPIFFKAEIEDVGNINYGLSDIYEFVSTVPFSEIGFLLNAAKTNMEIANYSLEQGYGIGVGKITLDSYKKGVDEGINSIDRLFRIGASMAAAASDARMSGCPMPVVINSGSGNQGITVSVPLSVMAEGLNSDGEKLARALCIAHLVALMITEKKGRLSALCGAFTAAIGTATGYLWLLGGTYGDIESCIDIMIANLIGILCDGAKVSCALKIYSCVEAASLAVKIALAGSTVPKAEGVLGNTREETLEALEHISQEGMVHLDKAVLFLLLNKNKERGQ